MSALRIENAGIYNSQIARPALTVTHPRRVSVFELELPLEDGGMSYIDSASCPIVTGTVICAKPHQFRHSKFPFKCHYIHTRVYDRELYNTLLSLPDFIAVRQRDEYFELFRAIAAQHNAAGLESELLQHSLFYKLVYALCADAKSGEGAASSARYGAIIADALQYITQHLTEDLSLNVVANHVSLSPTYFHGFFKRALGKTLHEYVEEKRISRAIELMLSTDMTLAEIAYACGFSSQSYFSSAFKRKMNAAPRRYIEQLNSRYLP